MISLLVAGLAACSALILLSFEMQKRNDAVYEERISIIRLISDLNTNDILAGQMPGEYNWRWDYYTSITYGQMMRKFWKPVESFYDRDYLIHGSDLDHPCQHPNQPCSCMNGIGCVNVPMEEW